MLNTTKLLYILPDLAYLTEFLPTKKEHEYKISTFKQISGKFLDENKFVATNIAKLFTKLDDQEYYLILPDFLFINTIVTIDKDSSDEAIKYAKEHTLPSLDINEESYEVKIVVLTTFKGKAKVQISAIKKSILKPITQALAKTKSSITAISPFSWTIKAIVSLEPSITVFQLGANLYSAQHYIGVNQTSNFPINKLSSIVKTIKTLKNAESSIQTVYLSSNALVEDQLKKELGSILPIQQLAEFKENDSKMPSYIKYALESGAKTLSISDFPVPQFKLNEVNNIENSNKKEDPMAELKKPQAPTTVSDDNQKTEEKTMDNEIKIEEVKSKEDENKEKTSIPEKKDKEIVKIETTKKEEVNATTKEEALPEIEMNDKQEETALPKKEEVNLSQFAGKVGEEKTEVTANKTAVTKETPIQPTEKKVIKNSSGINNMLKMIFITLAVFFITIAIGIGVGMGILKMSDKKTAEVETMPEVVVEPTATPEPTAEPEEEIDKENLSILVVNATTKAGYAGKIKTLLTDNEFNKVDAGNAKGEYEDTTDYILMEKENETLHDMLEEATELTLEYSDKIDVENQNTNYDVVIVLAK